MPLVQRARRPIYYRERDAADREVVEPAGSGNYALNVVSRVIWFIAGVISLLLALRFVLAALAANPANGFVNFIYRVSHPFAVPFFNMFHYNDVYAGRSGSHIEIYTLVAIAVYLIVGWILSALVNIGRRY
jgi:hypothetical protein